MSILVVSYEFTYSPFSGNGVLARSLVKGLLSCGLRVVVICAKPHEDNAGRDHPICSPEVPPDQEASLLVLPVTITADMGWRRLDARAAHQAFATGAAAMVTRVSAELAVAPTTVAIDWTGGGAWIVMRDAWPATLPPPRCLYINFRVYSSGIAANADPPSTWYDDKERACLSMASHVLALSKRDQASLLALLAPPAAPPVTVLLPCLRGDMAALAARSTAEHVAHLCTAATAALPAPGAATRRVFVACVNRLSAEKNSMRFAELLEAIGPNALASRGLVPLLCGAAAEPEYAAEVRRRVKAAAPRAVLLDHHLGPDEMAALFAHTALNLHPCAYDAYGMSVVEAAAFGAPSLVNGDETIGATALLGDGCVQAALAVGDARAAADVLLATLDDQAALDEVAERGRERALGWGEEAAGRALHEIVKRISVE